MSAQKTPILLLNAFSVNQLAQFPVLARIDHISLAEAHALAADGVDSAVGHASTAAIFSRQLGVEIPYKRCNVSLEPGDRALLGQYRGPRLPEGATELPGESAVEWFLVHIIKEV